jgi:hypothetical protein
MMRAGANSSDRSALFDASSRKSRDDATVWGTTSIRLDSGAIGQCHAISADAVEFPDRRLRTTIALYNNFR